MATFQQSRQGLEALIQQIDAKAGAPQLSEVRAIAMAALTHAAVLDSHRYDPKMKASLLNHLAGLYADLAAAVI
jgi:hypothetical protein